MSKKRDHPDAPPHPPAKRARPDGPGVPVPSQPTPSSSDGIRAAFQELKHSFDSFVVLTDAHAAELPKEFFRALRPVKGCMWRLDGDYANTDYVREAVGVLHRLATEAERICGGITNRELAERIVVGLYDFQGAVFDLKGAAGLVV